MLAELKLKQLQDLVRSSGKDELIWMNGYISGIINKNVQAEEKLPVNRVAKKMTIVYGTETGNSKKLATGLAAKAKQKNIRVKLASLDQYRITDITKEENLFVVISTQGDGEPPVAAKNFYDHIHHNGFRLDKLKYCVLALGDTSYPLFCKTGEDVDIQLQKLGGTRILPIQKCDVDYESDAEAWFSQVLQSLNEAVTELPAIAKPLPQEGVRVSAKKIYTGKVLSNINLHDRGSAKETRHIELAAEEMDYQPGDSVGIVPQNPLPIVRAIIDQLGMAYEKPVLFKETEYTLFDLLKNKLTIQHLHERVVKKYSAITGQKIPETKMDLLDLLKNHPLENSSQFEELIQVLPVQSPRIYTIASSPSAHNEEIHLTVEKNVFEINGKRRTGLCSDYLSNLEEATELDFFVQRNKRFKLPQGDKDLVMITPGTGIAAFRSFISERDATGATGKNWLFFGEEHFQSDFFYQTEIQNWFETGVLSKLSLAFSKDQPGIHVWHKMLEHGRELFNWIHSGASIYVCGEKSPMGAEVEKALLQVIETHSGLSAEAALTYFEQLKEEGRYSKDVY